MEVDLDVLGANLAVVRETAGSNREVILVVKADAYGHGAVAVTHAAMRAGIRRFGVGDSTEALQLRSSGVDASILVLGSVVPSELPQVVARGIEVAVHTADRIDSLEHEAALQDRRVKIHVNVDTGMGRLGTTPEHAVDLIRQIHTRPHLELAGLMTHFAMSAGSEDPYTAEQVERFDLVIHAAREAGEELPLIHAANSAALFTHTDSHDTGVRIGAAAYGFLNPRVMAGGDMRPVLSLKSQIVYLKDVPTGTTIGYDRRYKAPRPTRIATCPIGYADGVPSRIGNVGHVLVRGHCAPIVGAVSMDYVTIDIGDVPGASVGDQVTMIGRDGREEVRIADWAAWADMVPYEIPCGVGPRVRRIYRGGSLGSSPAPTVQPAHASEDMAP